MPPPPPSIVTPTEHKRKFAVGAQMLLSVFDVELGRWVALYPKVCVSVSFCLLLSTSTSSQWERRCCSVCLIRRWVALYLDLLF